MVILSMMKVMHADLLKNYICEKTEIGGTYLFYKNNFSKQTENQWIKQKIC